MLRTSLLVVFGCLALGACSGHGGPYTPPVDPMLPGDGYHDRTGGPERPGDGNTGTNAKDQKQTGRHPLTPGHRPRG